MADGWMGCEHTQPQSGIFCGRRVLLAAGRTDDPWGHHRDSTGITPNVRAVSVSPGVCELD